VGKRIAIFSAGYGLGLIVVWLMSLIAGRSMFWMAAPIIGGTISSLLLSHAQRRGIIPSREELNRPLTLFPRK
jgi:hypothetical protein